MPVVGDPITPPSAEGDYTNQSLMEAYAGQENLNIYGDVEGEENAADIIAGVQSGIDMAEKFTNWLARRAGHTVIPLTAELSEDFPQLQALVTKLAIAETYFKRAKRDNTSESNPVFGTYGVMTGLYKQARADLEAFFAGDVDGSGADPVTPTGTMVSVPIRYRRACVRDENGRW